MCLSQIDVPPTSGLQSTFYTEQLKNANSNYPVTWDENEVMQASEIVQAKIDLAGKFATSGCGQKLWNGYSRQMKPIGFIRGKIQILKRKLCSKPTNMFVVLELNVIIFAFPILVFTDEDKSER